MKTDATTTDAPAATTADLFVAIADNKFAGNFTTPEAAEEFGAKAEARKVDIFSVVPNQPEETTLVSSVAGTKPPRERKVVPNERIDALTARVLAKMEPGKEYKRAQFISDLEILPADWTRVIKALSEAGTVVKDGQKRGALYFLADGDVPALIEMRREERDALAKLNALKEKRKALVAAAAADAAEGEEGEDDTEAEGEEGEEGDIEGTEETDDSTEEDDDDFTATDFED